MNDNNKFVAGLLLGALAGAALAVFLQSEKGKQVLGEVKEGADKVQDDLSARLKDFDTAMNELLEKGKSFLSDLEQKINTSGS